jgi:hypothetical protein
MTTITDEYMREMLATTKNYCVVVLKPGPRRGEAGTDKIIWEHGRRNFALRAEGRLAIVCPVGDSEVAGIGIFNATVEETDRIMREDPAVKEGVLLYALYNCRSFPGDKLS